MLGSGFSYCMIPLLRKRGLSGQELDDAVRSHMGPFNAHPYLAGLALDRQDAYDIYDAIVGYRRYPRALFQVSPRDEAMLLRGY